MTSYLVNRDAKEQVRGANGSFFMFEPNLALSGGRPNATDEELFALMHHFKEIAHRLAPSIGYAVIAFGPDLKAFAWPSWRPYSWWPPVEGGGPLTTMADLCDEVVFDAFPYQILGPGHLKRLGGSPLGGKALGGGRVGLSLGDPHSWLPDSLAFAGALQEGRRMLTPCLLTGDELNTLRLARTIE